MSKDDNTPEEPEIDDIVIDGFFSGGIPAAPIQNAADFHDATKPAHLREAEKEAAESLEKSVEERTFDQARSILEKASSQIIDDGTYMSDVDDVVEHPYNMDALMHLNDMSVVRRACIDAIATNVARLGYRIKKTDPEAEEKDTDEVSEQITDLLEKWAEQDDDSFADLIYKVKFDEESCGNGYIEVTRDKLGRIAGLHHVPAQTIFRKKDRSGYLQKMPFVQQEPVPFYNFGDKYTVNEDGTHTLREDREPDIHELIHFDLHSPNSQFYGLPRDINAITTIYGDELARNHNTKFFTHSATPELMLIFEVDKDLAPRAGGKVRKSLMNEQTKREIADHFRRTLSSSQFTPGIFHLPPGVKLRIERLTAEQKDAGWTNFRKDNRNEVRIAFRTPPAIITDTEASGGYASALAEKSLYLEQVIMPEQERYSRKLMAKFWPEMVTVKPPDKPMQVDKDGDSSIPAPVIVAPKEGTGVNRHLWKLAFKRMSIADQATMAQVHNIYATLQCMTINEIRAELGKKPLPGGDRPPTPPQQQGEAGPGAHPEDIRGLQGRVGGGRGPNGTVSVPMPRRVGENGIPQAANLGSAGMPVAKSDDIDEPVLLSKEAYEELVKSALDRQIDENGEYLEEDGSEEPN